jgi:outer membrane protein assembly factor BamA
VFTGIGIPYGNSTYRDTAIMPYIKQFFAGGPNSLRGWGFRRLGPGGYDTYELNQNSLDQTGDIKFEFNVEYRFNIFKSFKGALFSDLGNVWLIKEDPSKPLANFDSKRFAKELAWDVGMGLRMDLSFFVMRFDVGFALYDPAFPEGDRWIFNKVDNEAYKLYKQPKNKDLGFYKFDFKDFVGLNFAIGYPF